GGTVSIAASGVSACGPTGDRNGTGNPKIEHLCNVFLRLTLHPLVAPSIDGPLISQIHSPMPALPARGVKRTKTAAARITQAPRFTIESSVSVTNTCACVCAEERPCLPGEPDALCVFPHTETRPTRFIGRIEEQIVPRRTNNERGVVIERCHRKAVPHRSTRRHRHRHDQQRDRGRSPLHRSQCGHVWRSLFQVGEQTPDDETK